VLVPVSSHAVAKTRRAACSLKSQPCGGRAFWRPPTGPRDATTVSSRLHHILIQGDLCGSDEGCRLMIATLDVPFRATRKCRRDVVLSRRSVGVGIGQNADSGRA
jgi:hypothetical protein